jgi:NAD(P)-dependent dehydrogenase (short-subunit alcohol dehydrogenase family)
MSSLLGDVVIVTGGNGGIGLAVALELAEGGADIAIWARREDKLKSAAQQLEATGRRVVAIACDVTDEGSVDRALTSTVAELGPVSTVFANAGVNGNGKRFPDTPLDEWRRVMAVNLEGVFLTLRAVTRHMIEVDDGGALIGVASIAAFHGAARNSGYSASKAGVIALMRSLAVELARYRIRSNTLVPGWVKDTDLTDRFQSNERFIEATTSRTPLRRWGVPADMASAARFLADKRALFHTGQAVVVDGGYTAF